MVEAVSAPEVETVHLKERGLLLDQGLVGGRWVAADDGATFDVRNPATGGLLARVPRMGVAETRRAIVASAVLFLLAVLAQSLLASLADNTVIFGGLHALDGLAILCIAAFLYASARRRGRAG